MPEHRTEPTTTAGATAIGSGALETAPISGAGNGVSAAGDAPSRAAVRPVTDCTIVIPVHNKASLTRQCLDRLLGEQSGRVERQIVVVDDGSTDLTAGLLATYAERVRVVTNAAAGGFARACNAGAAGASGRYLVFLNNDTLPRPGWLAALVAYADAHPAAAVVGAKLLYPNDTIQHAGLVFGLDRYPHHLYAGFPADHPATDVSRRFQAVTAACCLIRGEAFAAAGGFDTGFVNGWEDVDLCLRLGAAGHEVHYCHESVLYHFESASRDLRAPRERQNRGLYEERWQDRVVPDDLGYYAADGLLTATYTARHPIRLGVSPLLAGIDVGANERLADKLLQERARQVAILLRNNLVMNLRVQEAELRSRAAEQRALAAERRLQAAGQPAAGQPAAIGEQETSAVPPASAAPSSPGSPSAPEQPAAAPTTPAMHPIIGACERPGRDPQVISGRFLVVAGWALSKAGIRGVETDVDGARRGEVDYGEWLRPDIAVNHADYPDGERCGFLGKVPMEGLDDGEHRLAIRVIARDGRQVELATRFELDSTAEAKGRILAACDRPRKGERPVVRDRLLVMGWALSPSGIRDVAPLVDGTPLGSITYGALRPDIAMTYFEYPEAEHSGFNGSVPVDALPPGEHTLTLRVTAGDGRETDLELPFAVDASAPPPGEVPHINAQYPAWLRAHSADEGASGAVAAEIAPPAQPTFGLLLPAGQAPASLLQATIDGVLRQSHGAWELRVCLDPGTAKAVRSLLRAVAEADPRVTTVARGPSAGAAEAALAGATAAFVGLLAPGDLLSPSALADAARALAVEPAPDVVYGDEDKIDPATGVRWDPFFKPDWSPDLLLSTDYLGRFVLYRRSLVEEIGGFGSGLPGSETYDLALRATERSDRVGHVPRLLVSHLAALTAETAGSTSESEAGAARLALSDALTRRGIAAEVEPGAVPGRWRVRYALAERPAVTVVLATGGKLRFLRPCLESLLSRSTYPNLDILVVDNSEGSDVAELCDRLAADHPNLRRDAFARKPFNYPAIINHAVSRVATPYVVLLNDDIVVVTPDWIEAMLEHAQRPEVGVVGAKLLYEDDTFQHAGVILGPYGGSAHAFKQFPGDHRGYFGLPNVVRNCSAVTFACAMMRRDLFDELGGLDAAELPIAFNDVDFCLRAGERGYRVVYTPHAVLYHHESVTKKVIAAPSEIAFLRTRWGHVIAHDPFYNPNLTRRGEDCSLNME